MSFGKRARRMDDALPVSYRETSRSERGAGLALVPDIGTAADPLADLRRKAPAPVERAPDPETRRMRDQLRAALFETIDIAKLSLMPRAQAEGELKSVITEIVAIRALRLSGAEQAELARALCDELLGFGPIEPLLARDDIGDIMVNGAGDVFIDVGGRVQKTAVRFESDNQLQTICQRLAARSGRRVDQSSPICDARLADGSRVSIVLPPLSTVGPVLTIRKFRQDRLRLRDLVDYGSISAEGARLLAVIAASRCNVLVSGGTGSGKTTLLNALSSFIDPSERIITCEDVAELSLRQPHVVGLETRPPNIEGAGEIGMTQLVRTCLRMRPERIIVGEVRGGEAFDLLQAMNTGHDGSMGTLHANTPRDALNRLIALVYQSGTSLPVPFIRTLVSGAVDVVVQTQRLRDGSRRVTHVTEVLHIEGDTLVTQDLLLYVQDGEDENGCITGHFEGTGIRKPRLRDKARGFGLDEKLDAVMESLNG